MALCCFLRLCSCSAGRCGSGSDCNLSHFAGSVFCFMKHFLLCRFRHSIPLMELLTVLLDLLSGTLRSPCSQFGNFRTPVDCLRPDVIVLIGFLDLLMQLPGYDS